MLARLLGLTAVSLAATVGGVLLAANAVGLGIDLKRRFTADIDWDALPVPARRELEAAA